jgi:hypothetical protein
MKHVVIYGPPAAGKHAVELELEKRTGFKRLKRRLTYQPLLEVFDWGSESFKNTLYATHTLIMAEAARAGIGTIFSFVFTTPKSHIAEGYLDGIEQNGGEACLVRLFAARDVMEKRVSEPWRAEAGIMSDVEQWRAYYEKSAGIDEGLESRPGLEIDTGVHSTDEVVDKIIVHYDIPLKAAD